jgi:hypothetical protein
VCVYYDIDNGHNNDTGWTYVAVTELEVWYRQSTGKIILVEGKKVYQRVYLKFHLILSTALDGSEWSV